MAQKTKKKLIRVWAIVSALVLILLTVATVLTQFVMQDVLASLLGRDVAVYAEGVTPLYATEYTNKDEVYQAANKLNERVCEEGFVLLKNEGNALPLASGSRITVFGKNSVNLAYGGSGSSGGDKSAAIDLYTSLQNAGFAVNPAMKPSMRMISAPARAARKIPPTWMTGIPCFTPLGKRRSACIQRKSRIPTRITMTRRWLC